MWGCRAVGLWNSAVRRVPIAMAGGITLGALLQHPVGCVFKKGEEGYLAMKSATEAKRADRLRATLHGVDAPRTNKRTVFVDDAAHAARLDADLGPQAAAAEMAERKAAGSAKQHARRMREIAKQRRELEQRSERAAKLGERLQQLGVERALQGKGRRRRRASDEGTQRHYKWSQERKR